MTGVPLAIVGAGPAGLSAAVQAAELGLESVVLDEAPRVGGQIYRQTPEPFRVTGSAALGRDAAKGQALFAAVARQGDRVRLRLDTLVWGVFGGRELALVSDGRTERLQAEALVIATGATERVYPFPGWTLPGVYTAGGMQVLLKSQRVLPGRRVLVAGTGPLLLVLAEQLHRAGARVAAVLELASLGEGWSRLHQWWGNGAILAEGLGYHWRRMRAGIPYLQRHAVLAARGGDAVREVVVGRVDGAWNPVPGSGRTLAVDALAVSHGFASSTELALLAGCEQRYDAGQGGWSPVTDAWGATSVPGVFVAGDCAGVAGSAVAEVEGRLAAVGAARLLGRLTEADARRLAAPLRARHRRLSRFRAFMDHLSRFRPGLLALCPPEATVCRCEEVTRGEIEAAIDQGYTHLLGLKLKTRATMGFCQGRVCRPVMSELLAARLGCPPEATGLYHPRPPLRPLTFREMGGEPNP